ncbi:MAG: MFS transporter [Archaeoglobaceae archaeon]
MVRSRLFVTCLSAFIVMLGVGIIVPLLPTFAEDLGASGLWIGIIFSSYSFSRLVFLPMAGRLSDVYGRKIIISVGLLLYALVSIFYIFAQTPEHLSVVRLAHGTTSAMIIPVAMAYTAEISPEGLEGQFMGSFSRCLFLGMAFGPLLGGVISEAVGIRYTFLSLSLMGFLTLILVIFAFPSEGTIKKREFSLLKSIKDPSIRIVFIFRFINSMGRGSVISFLPLYLGIIGFSKFIIGSLISINLFTSALIQPGSGKLSDKIGPMYPVSISTIFGAIILFFLPRVDNIGLLIMLSIFLGFTSALSVPAINAIIATKGKSHGGMGELMGTLSASKSLGRIAGPIISGIVYDLFGAGLPGLRAAFTVAAILALVAGVIFWLGVRRTGKES